MKEYMRDMLSGGQDPYFVHGPNAYWGEEFVRARNGKPDAQTEQAAILGEVDTQDTLVMPAVTEEQIGWSEEEHPRKEDGWED